MHSKEALANLYIEAHRACEPHCFLSQLPLDNAMQKDAVVSPDHCGEKKRQAMNVSFFILSSLAYVISHLQSPKLSEIMLDQIDKLLQQMYQRRSDVVDDMRIASNI
jgi:hypothetical protein